MALKGLRSLVDLTPILTAMQAAQAKADAAMTKANSATTAAAAANQASVDAAAKATALASTATSAHDIATMTAEQATSLEAAVAQLTTLANSVTVLNQASVADRAALHATDAAMQAAIDALTARGLTAQVKRFVATAIVALNGTGTVTITWDTPFPNATYIPLLIAPVNATNVAVTAQTATGCTLTYKAGLAVAVGAVFNVVGIRFA